MCRGHEAPVIEIFWHPAIPLISTSSHDGTSRLWDADSGRQLLTITGTMKGFHQDGSKLAVRLSQSVVIYNVLSPEVLTWLDRRSTGTVAMHPTERLLAAIHPNGVRLVDPGSRRILLELPIGQTGGLTFHPTDGSLVTSGAAGLWSWPMIRSIGDSSTTLRIGPPLRLEDGLAPSGIVRVNADGKYLLVADGDNQSAWVVDRSGIRPRMPLPVTAIASMDISPDGQWAAGGDHLGEKVSVWNTQTGLLEKELPVADGFPFLRFSPDGKWLAANGLASASIWKVKDWSLAHTIPLNCHGPAALAFSPDSTLIAIGRWGDSSQLYEVETGKLIASLESPHHPTTFRDMLFTADGRQLICTSDREGTYLVRVLK